MTDTLVVEATIQLLPIELIRPSSTNPRQRIDPAGLSDLQSSIASAGMQTAMIVRDKLDFYELVTGSRRLRAAENLGWKTVPCIVREMTDAEARQWQIIENLQRENVPLLEEAEAFDGLLRDLGSIPAVAREVGKEQSYVAKCLRLMALTLPSRDALRGGLIGIEHAMLLARLATAEQNAALKWTLDHSAGSKTTVDKVLEERLARRTKDEADKAERGYSRFGYQWEPQSVVRLKSWIEAESGILLSRAPWSLTDEDYLLPDVGPCSECPKNTKANSPLFGDLEMGEATCTDGACFAAKSAGFVQIAMRGAGHDEMAKPKVMVPRLSWKFSSVKPSIVPNDLVRPVVAAETANPAKLLKKGQWVEAKPGSCSNVRPGVTVDWSDDADRGYIGGGKTLRIPGEVLQVCIAAGCKAHRKDWEKPDSSAAGASGPSAKELKEQAERAAKVTAENVLRSDLRKAMLPKVPASSLMLLRRFVASHINQGFAAKLCVRLDLPYPHSKDGEVRSSWQVNEACAPVVAKHVMAASTEQLTVVAFEVMIVSELEVDEWEIRSDRALAESRDALWAMAKTLGLKPDVLAAKLASGKADAGAKDDKKRAKAPVKPASKSVAVKASPKKKASVAKQKLSVEGRKAIADAMKKRWAERRSGATVKPAAKKAVAKKAAAKKAAKA